MSDKLGRPLRDLRISVTDRCNFRCIYCMPKEVFGRDYAFLPRRELLTFEEIERLARVFVAHGVEKLRLTGGEPLVRRDLERLVAKLAAIDGRRPDADDERLAARRTRRRRSPTPASDGSPSASTRSTTRSSGAMNDVDFPVERVLDGIEAAAAAGLAREGQHGRQPRR